MAGEARVNETRGGVSEQAEAAEAGFTFETRGNVVTQRHNLIRGPENKLARMKDELAVSIDVHEERVRSGCSAAGSMTGYLWLSKRRKKRSRWMSTEDG